MVLVLFKRASEHFAVVVLLDPDTNEGFVVGPEAFHTPLAIWVHEGPGPMSHVAHPFVSLHVPIVCSVWHYQSFYVLQPFRRLKLVVMIVIEGAVQLLLKPHCRNLKV